MAVSAETMLVLKTCARAMETALRTNTKIAQILVEKRAFISFKGQFLVISSEVDETGRIKSLSYNVKAAFFVTLQRFSFLIPLPFESPIAILVMSSEIDAFQLNGQS
jgi:hypothetical protein